MFCPDYQNLTDEELAYLVNQGEHSAFAVLVKRHSTKFYAVAFRMLRTREQAEDIVQDCFLKFWQNPSNWNSKKGVKFTTWFYRVVINKCYDALKKSKELRLDENFDIEDETKNAEKMIDEEKRDRILNNAFLVLSKKQKTAIALSFIEGAKNQESAEIMGLSLKGFQSLLMRSKVALKEKFLQSGGIYG
ncbi:MAG TPA: hypothetical protein DIV86_03315 [Alphaproteobacteria bacterium]|nr:hypothetical protein [Alphaproteobacteria bacterium]